MNDVIDSRALIWYRELVKMCLWNFSNPLIEALDKSSLSFWFLKITNAILSLAPQEINEKTSLPNYYISGSLAMNLLPSIDKITLNDGHIINFNDNIRKEFEFCYRKIHDFDFISTSPEYSVSMIAKSKWNKPIKWINIRKILQSSWLSEQTLNNIMNNCINNIYIQEDSSMDEQWIKDFHFCKATIKSQNWNVDVFITDPRYLLWYKFSAYLRSNNNKDKSDFLNLYKWLSMIFWKKELKCVCMKYKELRPDLFD